MSIGYEQLLIMKLQHTTSLNTQAQKIAEQK